MIWKEEEEAEEKSFEKKTTICSEVHTILHKNYSEIALRERERERKVGNANSALPKLLQNCYVLGHCS